LCRGIRAVEGFGDGKEGGESRIPNPEFRQLGAGAGKRQAEFPPVSPRCRDGVNSPYLPA